MDRLARLWRSAPGPLLRPYVVREHAASSPLDLRGPFDSLVRDLVEIAFRELGHARLTAPRFGGRPVAAWLAELRRRTTDLVRVLR